MDPYPHLALSIPFLLLGALLAAGRSALTILPDGSVKKLSVSEDPRERRVATLLSAPAAFFDGLEFARLACTAAACILLWDGLMALPVFQLLTYPIGVRILFALLLFLATVVVLDIFCYLLPARVGARHAATLSRFLSGFCWLCSTVLRPLVGLSAFLAKAIAKVFGVPPGDPLSQVTEEEIRMMVDMGNEKGAIEKSEKDMINNIFEFDDRCVSEVMTHRTDMTVVPLDVPLAEVVRLAMETGYSRLPVYGEDIDDIEGILYVKDLLCLIGHNDETFEARNYMRKVLFIPENMPCVNLFTQFKQKKLQVAIAVDEYGGTSGIVSMEDLLESIVGNIQDEYDDEEEDVFRIGEDCYLIDGTVSIDEVEHLFDVPLDAQDESDYDTIGGLLTDALGGLPDPDEHPTVTLSGLLFTVVLVEERRIARIRVERMPPEEPQSEKGDKKEKVPKEKPGT